MLSISQSRKLGKLNTPSSYIPLKNTPSKAIVISILILSLILVSITALSLPSIVPIWSPLIPLGVLIIAIIISCVFSKPQVKEHSKVSQDKTISQKEEFENKSPLLSRASTRQNSLSSLLNEEDNLKETKDSYFKDDKNKLYKSDSSSSLNTILSEAINQALEKK